ncbi:DNA sulfur modification protein DndC [Paenibacillus mucilaginosus]|uniref:phosphoadenosine phosphosulfate reductase domain-containing protein n=1 Tax=Paenibacillus mucilaginosus TaxID=61624 RepID=UPI003D234E50
MQDYRFVLASNKVIAQGNLKKHTALTKQLWMLFQEAGYSYYGTTRDWTTVIGTSSHYLALHHFIEQRPDPMMIDADSGIRWRHMLPEKTPLFQTLHHLEQLGFSLMVPEQCFIDAMAQEVMYGEASWHLHSPKHKLSLWALSEGQSFLFEYYRGMPFPPYGLKEEIPWPALEMVEYTQTSLFDDLLPSLPAASRSRKKRQQAPVHQDEQFLIDEEVPREIDKLTDRAIERVFREMDIVVVAFSGGKDSYVLLLKCIGYKLAHPECSTELHIISADTGVENPLLQAHVRNVQKAVWSLPIHIPFTIVAPKLEDRYYVSLFGKSYAPPSTNFKWCVNRLKVTPGREALAGYVGAGLKVCQVIGLREMESQTRSASIEDHYGANFYGTHPVAGIQTCAPIRHWSARNVVTYLVHTPPPWEGYGNYNLLNLYGSAMGGVSECPIGAAIGSENDAVKACSGSASRFGCYACTVINEDESLRNMIGDYPELEPYYRFRTVLKQSQDIRYGYYTAYQRKGAHRFEPGFGDLSGDARTILAKRMIELGIHLNEDEVLESIRQIQMREIREGNPVSPRLREALLDHLPIHPLVTAQMFDPILDPEGVIDRRTQEDIEAIDRILQMERDGLIEIV